MTAGLVLDTHTLVWLLMQPKRLSPAALGAIQAVRNAGEQLFVPTICLVEVAYLIEKRRLSQDAWGRVREAVGSSEGVFVLMPLDIAVADSLRRVSAAEVPEMPDRIIAATASMPDLPLVTRDRRITLSSIETIG